MGDRETARACAARTRDARGATRNLSLRRFSISFIKDFSGIRFPWVCRKKKCSVDMEISGSLESKN